MFAKVDQSIPCGSRVMNIFADHRRTDGSTDGLTHILFIVQTADQSESPFNTVSSGKLFHLLQSKAKRVEKCVVRQCFVQMLCVLRRLYVERVPTVAGIIEERYAGERLLTILYRSRSLCYLLYDFQSFSSDFLVKGL